MSDGEPILEVRDLGHRYGDFEALRGLSLRVDAGECVALIGHNGSGKTTAVRVIAGLLAPSAGEVRVLGEAVGAAAASAATAVVLDTPALYEDLTVAEHLELVALAHGVADDELDERALALLVRLGLAARTDAVPGALSRGMRQKLSLACSLVRPFRLLVLDEPVVGLDPAAQRTLRELIAEAVGGGAAVETGASSTRQTSATENETGPCQTPKRSAATSASATSAAPTDAAVRGPRPPPTIDARTCSASTPAMSTQTTTT